MDKEFKRCFRCSGRKKMYKHGSIYTHTDCGGVVVDCPLCLGKGVIKIMKIFSDVEYEDHEDDKSIIESEKSDSENDNSDVKKRRGRKKKYQEE